MKQAKTAAQKHKARLVCLPEDEHAKAQKIGKGNFSKGVRIAINCYVSEDGMLHSTVDDKCSVDSAPAK